MKRACLALVLALVLVFQVPGTAFAVLNVTISPSTQTHAHGVASHWSLSWNGQAAFTWLFEYGDGAVIGDTRSTTSASTSHTFWLCSTTKYTQWLSVRDSTLDFGVMHSYAWENGGNPC